MLLRKIKQGRNTGSARVRVEVCGWNLNIISSTYERAWRQSMNTTSWDGARLTYQLPGYSDWFWGMQIKSVIQIQETLELASTTVFWCCEQARLGATTIILLLKNKAIISRKAQCRKGRTWESKITRIVYIIWLSAANCTWCFAL